MTAPKSRPKKARQRPTDRPVEAKAGPSSSTTSDTAGGDAIVVLRRAIHQDRLGQRKAALQLLDQLLRRSDVPPQIVFHACNLVSRLEDSDRACKRGVEAYRAMGSPVEQASALLYIALRRADWTLAESLIADLKAAHQSRPEADLLEGPRTHVLWCDDQARNTRVVQAWQRRSLPRPAHVVPPDIEPPAGRRLRIGYLSSDFREHPTARLLMGALRNHDQTRCEVFLYCSGWDDGSPIRRALQQCASHPVRSLATLSDADAATVIRSDRIDVLVECNGPTRANRMGILAHRPAPVQIGYLGWPGSYGGGSVDYVIGDAITIPDDEEKQYPERVIRVSPVYQINDYAALPDPGRPPRRPNELPAGAPVLGMFNAINKVRREVWRVWMRILLGAPGSVLWVLDPGPSVRDVLWQETQAAGVDPVRVMFAERLPQAQHLQRLRLVDLMLDPWPYGGHTSTSDALWAGVPVLAMEGRNFVGRVSGALLKTAGFGQLVMPDADTYVHTAVELLKTPGALADLQQQVRSRVSASGLFDATHLTRQLETAYATALDRAHRRLATVHIRCQAEPMARPTALPQTANNKDRRMQPRRIKLPTLDIGLVPMWDHLMSRDNDYPGCINAATPPSAPHYRYLICSTPRSGSTLVANMLELSGQAGKPLEYLNRRALAAWLRAKGTGDTLDLADYLADIEARRTSPNGVFGMKAHFDQVQALWHGDSAGLRAFLERFDAIIVLSRRDKLAQAVSLYRAQVTQVWSSKDKNFLAADDPRLTLQPAFDPARICNALQLLVSSEQGWAQVLKTRFSEPASAPLTVVYEDFAADIQGMSRKLLDALDLPQAPVAAQPELQPQSSGKDPLLPQFMAFLGIRQA